MLDVDDEYPSTVELLLPKFKFENKQEMKVHLSNTGLTSIFGENADFSKISSIVSK